MARLKNAILGTNGYATNSLNGAGTVDVSLLESGQQGHAPNMKGYASNTAYVRRNIVAVLHEAPTGFQYLPNPEKWVATLKAMIELHANTIEGLNSTLTVEYGEEAIGGAGEFMETVTNVTRERTVVTFTWTEKYGKPFNSFLTGWINSLMMNPETKVPEIIYQGAEVPEDLLADFSTMSVLFFEPDPTHTRVVTSWLVGNMGPKSAGEVIGSRDLTTGGEIQQMPIEFTGITQVGLGVNNLAQTYLNELNLVGANPNLSDAFIADITADVKAAEAGYSDNVANTAAEAVTPVNS